MKVEGAGGHNRRNCGYIECMIQVPFLDDEEIEVPALIVPTTQYSLRVPVVVGTNSVEISVTMPQEFQKNVEQCLYVHTTKPHMSDQISKQV